MLSIAFLFGAAAKATVILAAAWLLALAMRRRSAAARYSSGRARWPPCVAIPAISPFLPRWDVRVKTPPGPVTDNAASPEPARTRWNTAWLVPIWLAGVAIMLARIGVGHLRLALSLRRAPEMRAPEWIAARDSAGERIGLRRIVTLRRSGETDVPLTGGVFAASVVLPETAEEWDAERRYIVLLHELTHARRRDPLLWLMAQVAVALYWFHPLAWLAAARFRREQERSCDDAVVRAGAEQSTYAQHLVDLARSVTNAGAYAAALGMAATSDLEQRVCALLDTRRSRSGLRRCICWTAVAAMVAAIVPLAALHGQESSASPSLSGTVYDASGAVVPGALILLKNNTSHQEAARANAAGEYKFSSLPAGSYTLEARSRGFAEFQKAVVLPAGQTNIILAIGTVTEAVEVVGKAPRPQETGTPHRIRVGGNVQATKLVSMIKPAYPPGAEAAGIEGTVLLRAVISTAGDLLGLSVINQSVDPDLASAAMDAVKQWHYEPTLLNGEPVEVVTTIAVTFRLER
jgi:TonB family protein